MANGLLNLLLKFSGLGWVLDQVNGYKTYIAAAGKIMTGLATLCGGVAAVLGEMGPLVTAQDYLNWAKALAHDPAALAIAAGVHFIADGLTDMGQRHAIAKSAALVTTSTPASTPK